MTTSPPTMLSFVRDLPNICSLTGLFFALISLYASMTARFDLAVIAMVWAVFFDWTDGIVARKLKGRTDQHRAYGAQLDSLIDIISFGACPAVFLLSHGNYHPFWLVPAFIVLAAAAVRLSWFNIFGLGDDGSYAGLALDNNILVIALVFLFREEFSRPVFTLVLATLFIGLGIMNLVPVKTPKFGSRWFPVLGIYCLVITLLLGFIL
ncbi:MAG: CDP-alcohol phosphatidyltransferase family protein [Desulfobacterales bacterium]|nr:CDP-alcohol phosphatidyltransferase family protein [Desulfobacterales bacterium]